MSQPRLRAAALAFAGGISLISAAAAHADTATPHTYVLHEQPAAFCPAYELRIATTGALQPGELATVSAQLSVETLALTGNYRDGHSDGITISAAALDLGAPSELPGFSEAGPIPTQQSPAHSLVGPTTPIVVSVPAGASHITAKLGTFGYHDAGGEALSTIDNGVVEFSPFTLTCTPAQSLEIPVGSAPQPTPPPTPGPTPPPAPLATTYSGVAGARFLSRLRGVGASKASLTVPGAPNGGDIDGSTLAVDPISAKLVANLIVPVTTRFQLLQAAPTTGTWATSGFALSVPTRLKVVSTRFLGVELVSGPSCESKATFSLAFTALGGPLSATTGKGTLPGLTGCGGLTSTLSGLFSGAFELSLVTLKPTSATGV